MASNLGTLPPVLSNYGGTSCFINATLHMIFASEQITSLLLSSMPTVTGEGRDPMCNEGKDGEKLLQKVLRDALQHYRLGKRRPIYPSAFLEVPFFRGQQADVSEFAQQILNSSVCSSPRLTALMTSSMEHRKICEQCNHHCVLGGSNNGEQCLFYLDSETDAGPLGSVQKCFQHFLEPFCVKEEQEMPCAHCSHSTADVMQQRKMMSLPTVLFVTLNVLGKDGNRIKHQVQADNSLVLRCSEGVKRYTLCSVVYHRGQSTSSGYYWCVSSFEEPEFRRQYKYD